MFDKQEIGAKIMERMFFCRRKFVTNPLVYPCLHNLVGTFMFEKPCPAGRVEKQMVGLQSSQISECQSRARAFLFEWGRQLDRARYAHFFEGGSAMAVLDALHGTFQNDDGGFGHGLEPDIRTQASSVIATATAFEIFHEIEMPGGSDPVQAGLAYLLDAYDSRGQFWPMVPPEVEDAPHAPWWTYENTAASFDGFAINPTAAVLGHLFAYAHVLPKPIALFEIAHEVTRRIVAKAPKLDLNEVHTVMQLHAAPELPGDLRTELQQALEVIIPAAVETDPDNWRNYTLQPLDVAPAPDSLGARLLPESLLQQNLQVWLDSQLPDGSWPIPWNWSFVDAAAWEQAERDWKGIQIVQRLRTLRAWAQV